MKEKIKIFKMFCGILNSAPPLLYCVIQIAFHHLRWTFGVEPKAGSGENSFAPPQPRILF